MPTRLSSNVLLVSAFLVRTIKRLKGHLVDALALRGDEGRNTLR